jgi:hypothetical protein
MTWTTCLMWFIRVFAPIAGFLMLLIAVQSFVKPKPLPRGFRRPALALELVHDTTEANQITAVYMPSDIKRDLMLDSCIFIPLYILLFLSLSFWLIGSEMPHAFVLAAVIGVCITLAGQFDVLENLRQWAILERSDQSGVDRIRQAALVKWFLLFFVTAVLSIPFLWRGNWVMLVGLLYFLTAIVGCAGVLLPAHRPLVEWASTLLGDVKI